MPNRESGRPNILWILGEDMSPDIACYGNADVATPNLDRLAGQGRLYRHAFATAPTITAVTVMTATNCRPIPA